MSIFASFLGEFCDSDTEKYTRNKISYHFRASVRGNINIIHDKFSTTPAHPIYFDKIYFCRSTHAFV